MTGPNYNPLGVSVSRIPFDVDVYRRPLAKMKADNPALLWRCRPSASEVWTCWKLYGGRHNQIRLTIPAEVCERGEWTTKAVLIAAIEAAHAS